MTTERAGPRSTAPQGPRSSGRRDPGPTAPQDEAPSWHCLSGAEALERLGSGSTHGLDAAEAARRLASHGPNVLPEARARRPWRILLDQFADFMILVLIAAAVVSGMVGEPQDTIAVVVIVVLNALIGFTQEWRAERAMAALRRLSAPSARVRRGGELADIPADRLVPGDIVLLEAGNVVPADLRLLETLRMQTAEAALTGESVPVDKDVEALAQRELPLGDRRNLAFKGTTVTLGRGSGVVVATGPATELGRIAALLAGTETSRTPLQKRLARFGAWLAVAVLAICAIVFVAGLLRGEPPVLMFLTAVSLAVAAIPEALPAVVSIALALGAFRMVRHQALIRRLPAVETLGSVTVICADKTGTLTENRMRVESWYVAGSRHDSAPADAARDPCWQPLLAAMALNNDARPGADGAIVGDPTEVALLEAAGGSGLARDIPALTSGHPRLAEAPFDSTRKLMTTVHRDGDGDGVVAWVKGAPEAVLARSVSQLGEAGEEPLDSAAVAQAAEDMAASGLRVLALARRRLDAPPGDPQQAEAQLTLLGLVGLMDPPRPEAAAAVEECVRAGITPVMITGDHPATARNIARRLGILDRGEGAGQASGWRSGLDVITGPQLAALDHEELAERARYARVYARVDPEQKIRIVAALQARGEITAMTGDGVNDAPALKRADIGVAMGRGGTDVAREAASLVLLDDNFATIVAAVREGRRIYDNIRKFIRYTMTSNSGEIWTLFLAPFLGLPIPLLPIHILWINLVTDGLPGLALAVEPAEPGVMRRPPRPPRESVFAHGMWQHMVWVGLLMGGVCLAVQAWAWRDGEAHWQTMVFTVLTLSQLGHALAVRSERESLFSAALGKNPTLWAAVAFTLALQLAVIYVPALNPVFHTEALSVGELAACLALSCVVFAAVEIEKALVRRGWLYGEAAG